MRPQLTARLWEAKRYETGITAVAASVVHSTSTSRERVRGILFLPYAMQNPVKSDSNVKERGSCVGLAPIQNFLSPSCPLPYRSHNIPAHRVLRHVGPVGLP